MYILNVYTLHIVFLWTLVPRYDWVPPYDGECLFDDSCLHINDTVFIMQDNLKSPTERSKILSSHTFRKSSILECVDNVCKCMAFGEKGERGIWDHFRLTCNSIVGSSCATRSILFPGEIVQTLFAPPCVKHAECDEHLSVTEAKCACKKGFKPTEQNKKCVSLLDSTATSFRMIHADLRLDCSIFHEST